jgi:hypothetical protein
MKFKEVHPHVFSIFVGRTGVVNGKPSVLMRCAYCTITRWIPLQSKITDTINIDLTPILDTKNTTQSR